MRRWHGWMALGLATGFTACLLEEYQAGPGGDASGSGAATGAGGSGGDGGSGAVDGGAAGAGEHGCDIGAPPAGAALPAPFALGAPPTPSFWHPAGNDEELAAALARVQPGEGIALAAGFVFSPIELDVPHEGSGWIVLASSELAGLPPDGTRVSPAHAPKMARINSVGSAPAIKVMSTIAHYWIAGLELVADPSAPLTPIVAIGNGDPDPISIAPHDIVLDRVWVHGDNADVYLALDVRSARTALVDSYLSDIHVGPVGCCGRAIRFTGPGPLLVRNNHIEASGPALVVGGPTTSPGLVPSDIAFVRNHFTRPPEWAADEGAGNIVQVHSADRVLVACNVLENANRDSALAVAHDTDLASAAVHDVTFSHNLVRRPFFAFALRGTEDDAFTYDRIVLRHSIVAADLDNPGDPPAAADPLWLFHIEHGPTSLEVEHLTAFPSGTVMTLGGTKQTKLRFADNLVDDGLYGFIGAGLMSTEVLDMYFPDRIVEGNVFIGVAPEPYGGNNIYAADSLAVMFEDYLDEDYTLSPDSPAKGRASDGTDPGADVAAVMTAIEGVVVP